MKIVIVCDVDVESGRGPVTRLASVLEGLSRRAEIVLVALGAPDSVCREAIARSGCRVHVVELAWAGWSLRNLRDVVQGIERIAESESADLVVLYREIWDLARTLSESCARLGVPFLLMPHSMPFLDAVARPSRSFLADFARHLARERRPHALRYMIKHVHEYRLMRTLPRVAINETVEAYLDNYFPQPRTVRAVPGYATEPVGADAGDKLYDLAFMAKLSEPKGIFETLEVLRRVRRTRPGARMVVIGSFEDDRVEREFKKRVAEAGLGEAVDLADWLSGPEKYRILSTARVFCYPSISADTFSLCLLEALSCGLPAVCYDVPFVRAVYRTPAVRRVPLRDRDAMADEVVNLLSSGRDTALVRHARSFAGQYASWDAVAEAEFQAYRAFLGAQPGVPPLSDRTAAVVVLGRRTTQEQAGDTLRVLSRTKGLDLVVVDDGVDSGVAQVLADQAPQDVAIVTHVRVRGLRDALLSGLRKSGARRAVLLEAGPGIPSLPSPAIADDSGLAVIARSDDWRADPNCLIGLAGDHADLARLLDRSHRNVNLRRLALRAERDRAVPLIPPRSQGGPEHV